MAMRAANIFRLGIKEFWSLLREPMLLFLIVFVFTAQVYLSATEPDSLNNTPIAIVDEDGSPLSARIASSFYEPRFMTPVMVTPAQVDAGMDEGKYIFVLDIPPNFQRDVLAGRSPAIQLNVDATRIAQAFAGNGEIQQIIGAEVAEFVQHNRTSAAPPIDLLLRMRFNPNLEGRWFTSIMEIINSLTMLSIILTGASLIREREHGTLEHLLVMPVTPVEIMLGKIWSMGLVVLMAALLSLMVVVKGILHVPTQGSLPLFTLAAVLLLFATTSLGIFMATLARSMPQFGMLVVLVVLPLEMLSGGDSPLESMPQIVQIIMQAAPTTHFVSAGQAILSRGAGIDVIWPQLLAILAMGGVLFAASLARFRKTISQAA